MARGFGLGDENGMSLIEVMIASAIMMVLALGMATFFAQQHNEVKAVKERASFTNVGTNVRMNSTAEIAVRKSAFALDP